MINKLRLKCFYICTVAVIAVLFILVGSINISVAVRTNKSINTILEVLKNNDGKMPVIGDKQHAPDYYGEYDLTVEAPFETRYFTVTIDESDAVKQINVERIFAVDGKTAETYALRAHREGKDKGRYGNYKFTTTKVNGDKMYIFLDCTKYFKISNSFYLSSVAISIVVLALVLCVIMIFSKTIINPIAESYSKQRRFITNANHEIKTPLAIISATNEIMEMEYGESEWTDTIKSQLSRLNDLTEKLIFLSRMEEDGNRYMLSKFSLSDTCNEISSPYSMLAAAQKKTFIVDIQDNVNIVGECSLIGRMLSMLLDNAFKYSPENGAIQLSVEKLSRGAKIVVKNNADNVKKGKLDDIFERFYRADVSRNSEISGHGIGLSIVKQVVNLHKGKINARSEDGKSVTITIVL